MGDEITIRRAESPADYQACQEAQRLAWGIADAGYVVPIATLVGAQLHGGLVLGAFLPDGKAVALSFAFMGRTDGRLCLYSQLTGVIPGQQSLGLGYRLKQAQRTFALEQGIDLIAWAFDPLRAGNARFNLDKLGASAHRYVDDMYGPRTDALNSGVPTDRLIAEWELKASPRPPLDDSWIAELPRLINVSESNGERIVAGIRPPDAPRVLLEVPTDIGALRVRNAHLAEEWRLAVRESFVTAFARGYRAVAFQRHETHGRNAAYYLLETSS